jgi:hypothetical protein
VGVEIITAIATASHSFSRNEGSDKLGGDLIEVGVGAAAAIIQTTPFGVLGEIMNIIPKVAKDGPKVMSTVADLIHNFPDGANFLVADDADLIRFSCC